MRVPVGRPEVKFEFAAVHGRKEILAHKGQERKRKHADQEETYYECSAMPDAST